MLGSGKKGIEQNKLLFFFPQILVDLCSYFRVGFTPAFVILCRNMLRLLPICLSLVAIYFLLGLLLKILFSACLYQFHFSIILFAI